MHLPHETIATAVEVAALNLLVDLFRLPKEEWAVASTSGSGSGSGGGVFTTGATASNILGLGLGREYVLRQACERKGKEGLSVGEHGLIEVMAAAGARRVQILSTMPHSSIAKAASVLGIGRANVVSVAKAEDPLEIDLDVLKTEVDREGVLSILAISAGEVNTGRFATGSLDTMNEVRRICDEAGVWIHVDGAFGLFGRMLLDRGAEGEYEKIVDGVEGLELADSITGDGHKLLNVPYDCGFFFTRHKDLSGQVFGNGNAAYLSAGAGSGDGIQSPINLGLENSKRFRALPAYASLVAYGREGYVDMLKRQIGLARRVTRWLLDRAEYEVLPQGIDRDETMKKTFIVVLFRARDEKLNQGLVKKINASGKMVVTGTVWDARPAARIAVSNWRADVERDGELIEEVLSDVVEKED